MNRRRTASLVAVCLLLVGPWPVWSQTEGRTMLEWVRALEGRSPEGRRSFITSRLDSLRVRYTVMSFDTVLSNDDGRRRITGANVVVRLGSGAPSVVVGAHYDAVSGSPGANDNGGGVAVLLMLVAQLRARSWNQTVEIVFFDQEEAGLVGSALYVERAVDARRHRAMVNLDVVGTGEVLYVGPVGGGDDDRVISSVRRAAKKTALPVDERAVYPGSDHLSFASRGLENISLSVMPAGVVDHLVALMTGNADATRAMPEVLAVMHTSQDSSSRMSGRSLSIAYTMTKEILLDLDAPSR